MSWPLATDRPIYLQLIDHIQLSILSGVYLPGDKLPSVRDLASEASVNPNTMQKALVELEKTGLVITNRTSGRMITDNKEMLKNMRYSIAREQLEDFLVKMQQLGFSKEELLQFITNEINKPDSI